MGDARNHIASERFAYVSGELAPDRARAVENHLTGCPECRQAVQDARETHRLLTAAIRLEDSPPDFTASVMSRVRAMPTPRRNPIRRLAYRLTERLASFLSGSAFLFRELLALPQFAIPVAVLLIGALALPFWLDRGEAEPAGASFLDPKCGIDMTSASKWPPPRGAVYHPAFYGVDFTYGEYPPASFRQFPRYLPPDHDEADALIRLGPAMPGGGGRSGKPGDDDLFGQKLARLADLRATGDRGDQGERQAAGRQRHPSESGQLPTAVPTRRTMETPTPLPEPATPTPVALTPTATPTAVRTPTPVTASRVVRIVGPITGAPGQEILVPVSLDPVDGFASADFTLVYSPSELVVVSSRMGPAVQHFLRSTNAAPGLFKISMSSSEAAPNLGEQILFEVVFRIVDEPSRARIPITFGRALVYNEDGRTSGVRAEPGAVEVVR